MEMCWWNAQNNYGDFLQTLIQKQVVSWCSPSRCSTMWSKATTANERNNFYACTIRHEQNPEIYPYNNHILWTPHKLTNPTIWWGHRIWLPHASNARQIQSPASSSTSQHGRPCWDWSSGRCPNCNTFALNYWCITLSMQCCCWKINPAVRTCRCALKEFVGISENLFSNVSEHFLKIRIFSNGDDRKFYCGGQTQIYEP